MQAMSVFNSWVDQYLNFEKQPQKNIFWLDTMQFLARRFNEPHKAGKSIHVAGSKGKGSMSAMIASILSEAGYFTGLYTSPHIIDFSERISSSGGAFDEKVYEKSVKEIMNGVDSIKASDLPGGRPITWFELVTLLGMVSFRNAGTDWNVYEVGLGGRLDATNIIDPEICCIGPIELEHTQYLGDTLEKIAAEKGGIIKNGKPVVVAAQNDSVKEVFRKIAAEKSAPIYFEDEVAQVSDMKYVDTEIGIGMALTIESRLFSRPLRPVMKLLGEFQCHNAALVSVAVKILFPDMDEGIIERGLSKAYLPGRFEIQKAPFCYENIPQLILDGAHTVNSIRFTMDTLENIFEGKKDRTCHLLFGCAEDKDVEDMARIIGNRFDSVVITRPGDVKASDIRRMEKAFDAVGIEYVSLSDFYKAIDIALSNADKAHCPLIVMGSFYLVSEVKKFLLAKKCTETR